MVDLAHNAIPPPQPPLGISTERPESFSSTEEVPVGSFDDDKLAKEYATESEASSLYDKHAAGPLAPADQQPYTAGAAILHFLHIRRRPKDYDLDAVATVESVFDGPLGAAYVPNERYENKDAFDPAFRWTKREEAAVRRKIDLKIFVWCLIMFLALDIDRGNGADNLLHDLKLKQSDYNLGNTLSKIGFLVAELPSQAIGKKLGVDIWLPIQICTFSVLSLAQFWMKGRTSFLAFRFFIALAQGGFIPDVILYLSYFYSSYELPIRLAFFWSINYLASTVTAFLAVGLLKMRGIGGHAGWQWMFAIEGALTAVVGVASFFMLVPGPSQTQTRWRPKGIFSEREVKIIVNKVVRDDPSKATMHNRQALSPSLLLKSFKDFDLWPMYLLGLTYGIPGVPLQFYFQISMKQLGFSTVMANLLSVPNTVWSIMNLLLLTAATEIFQNRWFICSLENWWWLAPFIALVAMPSISPWIYFALATVILSFPYAHAAQVGWASRNSGSVRTRTVSASLYNMFVQASSIIGANIYQASDAPRYRKGNAILLGITAFNLLLMYPGVGAYYKFRNRQKAKQWNALTTAEKRNYLETTTDEGCRRLDFRFAY
ncbi:hypothetical protein BMF94_1854 [Rhodotorula taiwanensis]|uniref:Major facilitator superfamily (MFS) profile domain-containing protein n=1 Tax=Rhodotorula taiwanensis TaxID=741276 RepID=A0A2S5BEM8_9BASI|nr:hypothetical protein BMF94_1854 [Rhodotorula taiwanensis]